MGAPSRARSWRAARDIPLLVLAVAIVLGMLRATRLDSLSFELAGTQISLVATDFGFLALGVVVLGHLLGKRSLPEPARALALASTAFAVWLLLSSALNGAEPLVGAVKLLEYGLVALGLVLFVRQRWQLSALIGLVVAITAVAVAYAVLDDGYELGVRHGSFMGEHELAAIGTLCLAYGAAALFSRRDAIPWLAWLALAAGAAATLLGAALASVLGTLLAFAVVIALAVVRRSFSWTALAVVVAIAVVVTAGTARSREGQLGFIRGDEPALSAERAGTWSQRLIYAYVGGRIFLDNPVLGTGWYGVLPAHEWERFLPDARERFPDQPPRYFPQPDEGFIPQQTYDQVLFQLGLLGALLFAGMATLAIRTAVQVALRWPRGGPGEAAALLPAAWLAALGSALAGEALFGGIAIATLFWLVLGVVALMPSLIPPAAR